MRIVFYPYSCVPFHGRTLLEKPIGGIEAAVICLAEELALLGHQVFVLTPLRQFPPSKATYLNVSEAKNLIDIDVLMVVRGFEGLFLPIKARRRFLWTGDAASNMHTIGIGDPRIVNQLEGVFFVSEWQRQMMCAASGLPIEKAFVLRNGVNLGLFNGSEMRTRKRLIYASNPQRGLIHLPRIFLNLKREHPELELHLFSNAALYDMQWPPKVARDIPHEALLSLMGKLPGCILHGTVLTSHLAREFMKSSVLTYPAHVAETSCMVALEAQAAGCAIVTSAMGGLPETVGDAGILIEGEPGSQSYLKDFTYATDQLLRDDVLWQGLSDKGKQRSLSFDWRNRAVEWLDFLNREF